MAKAGEPRYRVIEWLMRQIGGPGPMFGQLHHFVKYNKSKSPYAEERYLKEARRYISNANRPAVRRGYKVPKDVGEIPMP